MRKITGVTHILIAAISKPENLHRHAATNRLPECRTSWIMVEGQFHPKWAFSRFFADCVWCACKMLLASFGLAFYIVVVIVKA